ncbi:Mitochondrial carnitine/acylcarnitine carrier-like protein [Porphyridium purpureum]|uniref:Mitochondrial carnitine/acylcarnitine carrier-like protein n=1 Tax=Porphyridium purpureum TaxID=35688 RepID=A0A5J4YUY9_PORPP|nr:Mitochondrial carnitine/acylcarnitine carrier-like protein [Porphyridium purpureum]|eukprot:POR1029..scf227_4
MVVESAVVRDLVAGTCAGAAQLVVGFPFDTVKVKLQNAPAGHYGSVMDAVRHTLAEHGSSGLFKGMGVPLATVAVFNAVLFSINGVMRKVVAAASGLHANQVDSFSVAQFAACGAGAGVGVSILATPTELIKCRLQAAAKGVYKGPIDVAKQLLASAGPAGLFRGYVPTVMREVPGCAIYFATYEGLKKAFAKQKDVSVAQLGTAEIMTSGSLAGLAFWCSVYPADVVKTLIQTDSDTHPRFRSTWHCLREIVAKDGVRALYRGAAPCFVRAAPSNAVCFVVYEGVARFLAG